MNKGRVSKKLNTDENQNLNSNNFFEKNYDYKILERNVDFLIHSNTFIKSFGSRIYKSIQKIKKVSKSKLNVDFKIEYPFKYDKNNISIRKLNI